MDDQKKLIILVSITFLIILAFTFVMVKMISENNQCVDSPFKYSAIRLNESGGNYNCRCNSLDPELLDFVFNEEGIKIINPKSYDQIDYSSIIIQQEGGN